MVVAMSQSNVEAVATKPTESMEHVGTSATSNTSNVASSTSSTTLRSSSSLLSSSSSHSARLRPSVPMSLQNHPSIRLLQSTQWDNTVFSLAIPRSAFGAAKVQYTSPMMEDRIEGGEAIIVAGGKGRRKSGVHSGVLNTVELFDPNNCTQAQICSHRLNIARYSCGAFAVSANVMCVAGGKGQRNEYLDSVELVSTTSAKLLPAGIFSLPKPMASFGVAVVAEKVYLFGGKTKEDSLSSVYRADLSHFVEANNGKTFLPEHEYVWKQVGILGSRSMPTPRHSFALVVEDEVCWMVGGFDGSGLLNTVGIYHTKLNRFMMHPATLANPRSGLTSFLLGRSIVVFGGISSDSTTSYVNGKINYDAKVDVAAEVLARDIDAEPEANEIFISVPNFDSPQKDQAVFRIGYRLFAIGQYNFSLKEPLATIPCLNLVNLRDAFELDKRIDGVVVPQAFPMPIVPMPPPEPKMSPDFDKLKQSIQEWKVLVEGKTQEYWKNVQEAETNSQMLHDDLVGVWSKEITRLATNLQTAKPEHANTQDKNFVDSKIEALRVEFELQVKLLKEGLSERIQKREREYDVHLAKDNKEIKRLENMIADYGTQLQTHRDHLESRLSEWINKKNSEISTMEGIISGNVTAAKAAKTIDNIDLVEDRKMIERVYKGLDPGPVMVSKAYGRQCTENYNVKNQIGVGGFGAVYRGNDVSLRCTFAFKRVSMIADTAEKLDGVLKSFQREVSTLKRVRHPNIVALYGYHIKPNSDDSFLIYEFLDRGSLYGFLRTEDGRVRLPYLRRLRIMAESLRALNFLHTGGCAGLEIQHRDIKPHNICLAEDWSAKLIDCGLARIERLEEPSGDGSTTFFSSANGLAGTDGYICKAYWNGMRPYLSACDIYSFGIVMIELITGTLNRQNRQFPGDFFNQFISSISGLPVENGLTKLMDRCDELVVWNENDFPKLCKLALQCISLDVSKRPSAKTLAYELSMMLLRGEIGELPESFSRISIPNSNSSPATTTTTVPSCSVCNEPRDSFIVCKNSHILCNQCITQESLVQSSIGREVVECPILECKCQFNIQHDLYAIVPQNVYNKASTECRILECLERIERGQNRVLSDISMVRKGVNRGLQAMASLTTSGNSPCPKLVWIIPGRNIKVSASNPSSWIKGFTEVPVHVYFLCEHSFTPVSKPVEITVKKKWLGRIAPALKITLFVLKLTTSIAGLPFPILNIGNLSEQVEVAAAFVDSLLDTNQCNLINQAESLFTDGVMPILNNNNNANDQLRTLTGQAYDLLADGVCSGAGQFQWKDELKPVLNPNGATIWVKNQYVERYLYSNGSSGNGNNENRLDP